MFKRVRASATATSSTPLAARRAFSRGCPRLSQEVSQPPNGRVSASPVSTKRARPLHHTHAGHSSDGSAAAASTAAGPRVVGPSYLYRPFMGHSTRFAALNPPLTRADITRLEREPLAHVAPGRVNDHVCIAMVKTLRWVADRAFRERYMHRATMLVTVAAAAPAAGSVAAYLRMFFKRRPTSGEGGVGAAVGKRTSVAAEVASPFLAADTDARGTPSPSMYSGNGSSSSSSGSRLHHSTPNSPVSGAALRHSYVDELRGLLAQSESHAVHYQILGSMAEITALERGLVLLLQAFHFTVYLALFLFYPRMGFRLMAYTAEESSVVWTQMVNDVDLGKIAEVRVPKLAMHYWGLEGLFTPQGALVPMVVAPKPQDVVLFKTGDRAGKAAADAEGKGQEESAAAANVGAEGARVETSSASPSKAALSAENNLGAEKQVDAALRTAEEHKEKEAAAATESTATDKTAANEESPILPDPSLSVFTLRDVVLLIRSDEMVFRDLNHEMANELDTQPGFLRRLVDRYEQR